MLPLELPGGGAAKRSVELLLKPKGFDANRLSGIAPWTLALLLDPGAGMLIGRGGAAGLLNKSLAELAVVARTKVVVSESLASGAPNRDAASFSDTVRPCFGCDAGCAGGGGAENKESAVAFADPVDDGADVRPGSGKAVEGGVCGDAGNTESAAGFADPVDDGAEVRPGGTAGGAAPKGVSAAVSACSGGGSDPNASARGELDKDAGTDTGGGALKRSLAEALVFRVFNAGGGRLNISSAGGAELNIMSASCRGVLRVDPVPEGICKGGGVDVAIVVGVLLVAGGVRVFAATGGGASNAAEAGASKKDAGLPPNAAPTLDGASKGDAV